MAQDAVMLPEHASNPFTAALGPPPSYAQSEELLSRRPSIDAVERSLPPHLRRYCVLRLYDFVHPRMCQLDLAEKIGMIIRNGYRNRDPARGGHVSAILDAADRREAKDVNLPSSRNVGSSADGFALVGNPGMGKTLTTNRILEGIPRLVRPNVPEGILQVPWLKVECPSGGTRRQFCIAFLTSLGARVGQDYVRQYVKKNGADEMMLVVQQLAHIHALGVLVVDEIQHLRESKEGVKALMSFFVTLVNTIAVPVMLIGTMGANDVIGSDFREARRSAGLGQPTWERLSEDEEWNDFVEDLWQFQWTDVQTPYSVDLGRALYDECQGIIDVAVRLFMMCQMRAILRGELIDGADESLTPELIRRTSEEDFKVIRPMMNALRTGRPELLDRYPDLVPLHRRLDIGFSKIAGMSAAEFRRQRAQSAQLAVKEAEAPGDPLNPIKALLFGQGITGDAAAGILAEALRRHPQGDPFQMLPTLYELVAARKAEDASRSDPRPPRTRSKVVKTEDDPKDLGS